MSGAVHPQSVEWGKLHVALDLQREDACTFCNRGEIVRGDYDLANRDQNAIHFSTVGDAGNAAAEIATDNGIHNVSRQRYSDRAKRFFGVQHSVNPPAIEARPIFWGLSTSERNKIFFYTREEFFSPSLTVPESERVHLSVHPVQNCSLWHRVHSEFVRDATPDDSPASAKCPQPRAEAGVNSVSVECSTQRLQAIETATTISTPTGSGVVANNSSPNHRNESQHDHPGEQQRKHGPKQQFHGGL